MGGVMKNSVDGHEAQALSPWQLVVRSPHYVRDDNLLLYLPATCHCEPCKGEAIYLLTKLVLDYFATLVMTKNQDGRVVLKDSSPWQAVLFRADNPYCPGRGNFNRLLTHGDGPNIKPSILFTILFFLAILFDFAY